MSLSFSPQEMIMMAKTVAYSLIATGVMLLAWSGRLNAQHSRGEAISVGRDAIGGVVTGANGPEAGVWVIAETADLPTKFVKIVVTDDKGRYVLPQLPKANYRVWVRGYGLGAQRQRHPGKYENSGTVVALVENGHMLVVPPIGRKSDARDSKKLGSF
jgi:hypothetical protein